MYRRPLISMFPTFKILNLWPNECSMLVIRLQKIQFWILNHGYIIIYNIPWKGAVLKHKFRLGIKKIPFTKLSTVLLFILDHSLDTITTYRLCTFVVNPLTIIVVLVFTIYIRFQFEA